MTPTVGEQFVQVFVHKIRVNVRPGTGVPIVLCNGIGVGLEVLDQLVEHLDPGIPVVRFDVPGTGGSPNSPLPYGFPYLAWVLGKVLDQLGYDHIDLFGLSWGGALAQQFAFQNPRRCRKLVLVSTGTGAVMVPAHPRVLMKMVTPHRFSDPEYGANIASNIYGGSVRCHPEPVAELFGKHRAAGSLRGYLFQLLAGSVWTSVHALWAVRQPTLIVAGTDDPIIPVVNAKLMHLLLPHSRLYLHDGGHVDVVLRADELAPVISRFLRCEDR